MGCSAQEVLGRKSHSISPNDHFLALGGHSMSVLQASVEGIGCVGFRHPNWMLNSKQKQHLKFLQFQDFQLQDRV